MSEPQRTMIEALTWTAEYIHGRDEDGEAEHVVEISNLLHDGGVLCGATAITLPCSDKRAALEVIQFFQSMKRMGRVL